jgi:hypothetical protein
MVKKTESSTLYLTFKKAHRKITLNVKEIRKIYQLAKRSLPKIPEFGVKKNDTK